MERYRRIENVPDYRIDVYMTRPELKRAFRERRKLERLEADALPAEVELIEGLWLRLMEGKPKRKRKKT